VVSESENLTTRFGTTFRLDVIKNNFEQERSIENLKNELDTGHVDVLGPSIQIRLTSFFYWKGKKHL